MASSHSIAGKMNVMDGSAIRVQQARCAKVRNRNVTCLKCADACTSGCISVIEGELVIDSGKCVGCGTCATVCPTCALEARNPNDAELTHSCKGAARDGRLVIACSQALAACAGLVDGDRVAPVVCAGRIEEALLVSLVAQGTRQVGIVCGDCARCAQAVGLKTARLVADTTRELLDAWGSDAEVEVSDAFPSYVLAAGHDAGDAAYAMEAYFQVERACGPINAPSSSAAPASDGELAPDDSLVGGTATSARAAEGDTQGNTRDSNQGGTQGHESVISLLKCMKDGTLPHFVPDRRERLLDALSQLGEPKAEVIDTRLWGHVVIDAEACTSCRLCATFCPTGAIRKFDLEDGTFGVDHFAGDCVRCGSCRDVCRFGAITIEDGVTIPELLDGEVHRFVMKPRAFALNDPHQIINTMKQYLGDDVFER